MTFNFNSSVPAASNNPSVDQPDMQTNNISTDAIISVDHISFNTANGGQHKQVTFNNKNPAGAQTDPQSVLYTGSGTASSISQLLYRNQNVILPISTIRAWALCSVAGVTASQSVNVSTVVRNSIGTFTITLTTNAVSSSNFAILVSSTIGSSGNTISITYSITGTGTFQLFFRAPSNGALIDPTSFSFQVMQI
jgi:hypothetical protein